MRTSWLKLAWPLAVMGCQPSEQTDAAQAAGGDAAGEHSDAALTDGSGQGGQTTPPADAAPGGASDVGSTADAPTGRPGDAAGDAGPGDAGPREDASDPEAECPLQGGPGCISVAAEPAADDCGPSDVYFGLAPEGSVECPAPSALARWRHARAFLDETLQPGQESEDPVPPRLKRFCVYEWQRDAGDVAPSPDLRADQALAGHFAGRLVKDCPVGGGAGTPFTGVVGEALETAFFQQINRIERLPVRADALPGEVRVAIVDASPFDGDSGLAVDGTYSHGLAMGRIVRETSCPAGPSSTPCIGWLSNHLALPRLDRYTSDRERGGYFGYLSDVATAIHTTIRGWKAHNRVVREMGAELAIQQRLVVNLSIGWDPMWGGAFAESPDELSPPVRAVYDALVHARCHGALIFAAAGNRTFGPVEHAGPMYPAAWESKPAPTRAECEALEGAGYLEVGHIAELPIFSDDVRPLVFAVGGVRHDDRPLENSRPGGRPALAATAFMAASEWGGDGYTDVMTGSSVAAAVASGTAALIWGYRPSLRPEEVVGLLHSTGASLDPAPDASAVHPDFCGPTGGCERAAIRRIDVCAALHAACAGGEELCPAAADLLACPERPPYAGALPSYGDALTEAVFEAACRESDGDCHFDGSLFTTTQRFPPECRANARAKLHRTAAGRLPDNPCPERQFYTGSLFPSAGPQPGTTPCPECALRSFRFYGGLTVDVEAVPADLAIAIAEEYRDVRLTDGTLTLKDEGDAIVATYKLVDLGFPTEMTEGGSYLVSGIPVTAPFTHASLSWTATTASGTWVVTNELLTE